MTVKVLHIACLAFFAILNSTVSNAQQFIGINGGYGKGAFTNLYSKQDYDANYHFKNGFAFSTFYEKKMDSNINLRIELQYINQRADMEIKYNAGSASFYKNINYSFQLLNFNILHSFQLIEKKSFYLNLLLGPTFSYTINTIGRGSGWEFYNQTQIDTNGNYIPILSTRNWEKNETNSKDLSKFNMGFDIGLDFIIPMSDRMDFIFQNRYNIFLTNITATDELRYKLRYTSLLRGYLNLGLRYHL